MTTDSYELPEPVAKKEAQCTCADHDEDCPGLEDKVGCWLYDPGRGMCPYLRAAIRKPSD
jgi:hypothetical protein